MFKVSWLQKFRLSPGAPARNSLLFSQNPKICAIRLAVDGEKAERCGLETDCGNTRSELDANKQVTTDQMEIFMQIKENYKGLNRS